MLKLDWNILFTCINVVIFYILLRVFVWKKILGVMEKRKKMINKQYKDADDAVKNANELKGEYENKLADADNERKEIIENAQMIANQKADSIIESAKNQSEQMLDDARETINTERQEALRCVKSDIAGIAIDVASKVVGKQAEDFDNSAVYDEFLNENEDD